MICMILIKFLLSKEGRGWKSGLKQAHQKWTNSILKRPEIRFGWWRLFRMLFRFGKRVEYFYREREWEAGGRHTHATHVDAYQVHEISLILVNGQFHGCKQEKQSILKWCYGVWVRFSLTSGRFRICKGAEKCQKDNNTEHIPTTYRNTGEKDTVSEADTRLPSITIE